MTDTVEHSVLVAASLERVWELLTAPEHVAQWYAFDGATIELRPGGRIAFTWEAHGRYLGRVESVEPPTCWSFRFVGHEADVEPSAGNSTLVTFTLAPELDGTRIRVVESGFAGLVAPSEGGVAKAAISLEGWRGGLAALVSHAVKS